METTEEIEQNDVQDENRAESQNDNRIENPEEVQDESTDEALSFEDLGLEGHILEAVKLKGYKTPTAIQALAIPRLLDGEANLIAKARTGTGKTAAFALPILQRIAGASDKPRALVLSPTRELALQICGEFDSLKTKKIPRVTAIYGGQSMSEQIRALKAGAEIVVGTPGRVMDHLRRKILDIGKIDYFILDEADQMLDMGFIDDIESIFSGVENKDCRILLFSATMPHAILKIASKFMGEYEIVEEEVPPEEEILITQSYIFVRESDKIEVLVRLIDMADDFYGLIFTQTKLAADALARSLDERGYAAEALHGDISQGQREKITDRFRRKKTRILVATDVAARGIDIGGLTHVVNYALPLEGTTYVHRIGRTGRAGANGEAVTLVRPDERRKLDFLRQAIRKSAKGEMTARKIPEVKDVLAAKRARLTSQIRGLFADAADGGASHVRSTDSFAEIAAELCKENSPEDCVKKVLEIAFGHEIKETRYGKIQDISQGFGNGNRDAFSGGSFRSGGNSGGNRKFADRERFGAGGFSSGNADQIRIYASLGRKDGYNPRAIAEYFSAMLGIPQRLVDGISMRDNFSLVSLPKEAAMRALDKAKTDKKLPHMHIDTEMQQRGGERKPYRNSAPSSSAPHGIRGNRHK
ncbi:MAG: DEAD/DEAH box helicase [Treponemataceae bacterium]|nr:MAG: DEAD/DEAH box helicase [Treponemataceae bacterium]